MSKTYFGTDGIRGRVGDAPITPDFMLRLGWAAGRVLGREGQGKVLIGKDTRLSGYMFESALESGLSAAGINVLLLGPMPTPAIAYLTRTLRASAGIVISASHNPYTDNGIKFFTSSGTKLPDSVEAAIEAELALPLQLQLVASGQLGKAERMEDARGRYIEFCKSTIPTGMEFNKLRVVIDCAHGATYQVAPEVFYELGAEVIPLGVSPNGFNINDQCGSTYPANMQAAVLEHRADLGIALDGDGDRLIMADHRGELVDGDELLFIIAKARRDRNALRGPVVGTLMSNLGLENALKEQHIDFVRTKVGDRYVSDRMRELNSTLGGESSGHIICHDCTTTGDGTVSALQVLAIMRDTGHSLYELKSEMKKYPQELINVHVKQRIELLEHPRISAAVREAEHELQTHGRILLRYSGTEPLVRVMVEGDDADRVAKIARRLASLVATVLAKAV